MKKLLSTLALSVSLVSAAQAVDIVDTAVAAGNFNTLATALKAAGLVETLKGTSNNWFAKAGPPNS